MKLKFIYIYAIHLICFFIGYELVKLGSQVNYSLWSSFILWVVRKEKIAGFPRLGIKE